jgi:hypothetical protein
MVDLVFGRPQFGDLWNSEHFGQKKCGLSYQEINIFVSCSVATEWVTEVREKRY